MCETGTIVFCTVSACLDMHWSSFRGMWLMVLLSCCSSKDRNDNAVAQARRWEVGGGVADESRGRDSTRGAPAPQNLGRSCDLAFKRSSQGPRQDAAFAQITNAQCHHLQLRVRHNIITKVCAPELSNLENVVQHMGAGRRPQNTSPGFAGPQRPTAPPGARRQLASHAVWEYTGTRSRPQLGKGGLSRVQSPAASSCSQSTACPPSCHHQPEPQKIHTARL
jgi:hypothetical protein